jgi:hypothetical protein
MDQRAFEQGLWLGVRTAALVCKDRYPRAAEMISAWREAEERRVRDMREPARNGRQMVPHDFLLPMPMMTAADLGLTP